MEVNLDNMCDWERKKAIYLLNLAEELGMDTEGYGKISVNPNSGYTYIWLEDYNFSLYMPITCELKKSDVVALWTNSYNGDEEQITLKENTTLEDLENWARNKEIIMEIENN